MLRQAQHEVIYVDRQTAPSRHSRESGNPPHPEKIARITGWMPACAGMTNKVRARVPSMRSLQRVPNEVLILRLTKDEDRRLGLERSVIKTTERPGRQGSGDRKSVVSGKRG